MASETRQPAALTEAQDRFVAVWGQMGAAWGISRTMAEVHALLFITGRPMNTDEIMERLQISRGNASMSLRALLDWGTVTRTHKRGDRKEYYLAEQDIWAMFRAILRERMKREVDPMLASLFEIRDLTGVEPGRGQRSPGATAAEDRQAILEHNQRLDALLGFFQIIDKLSQRFVSPSGRGLQLAATMLNKVS
jgi:HTH-type transcriptional regulator, glycine betaine synthesis regulator